MFYTKPAVRYRVAAKSRNLCLVVPLARSGFSSREEKAEQGICSIHVLTSDLTACGQHGVVYIEFIEFVLLVGCLTSQQHASVSQGRICSDNFTCCHTEIEVADPTFYFTQSQYTDTGPTSPSADPTMPGAWQGSHWSANF